MYVEGEVFCVLCSPEVNDNRLCLIGVKDQVDDLTALYQMLDLKPVGFLLIV